MGHPSRLKRSVRCAPPPQLNRLRGRSRRRPPLPCCGRSSPTTAAAARNEPLSAGASADASSSSGLSLPRRRRRSATSRASRRFAAELAEGPVAIGGAARRPLSALDAGGDRAVSRREAGESDSTKDAYGTTPIEYAERHEQRAPRRRHRCRRGAPRSASAPSRPRPVLRNSARRLAHALCSRSRRSRGSRLRAPT